MERCCDQKCVRTKPMTAATLHCGRQSDRQDDQDVMGVCHSASCGSRSDEFEYYNEAYRHQTRHRARAKLVGESLAATGDDSAAHVMSKTQPCHPKQKRLKKPASARAAAATRSRHPTQLWMCDQGCCSIRWKLDYADFQSYTIYAQVSPYVVVQDKTGKCVCVICKGLSDKTSSASLSAGSEKTPAIIRKACESRRLDANALQDMVPTASASASTAMGSLTSSSSLLFDGSTTDDDDDDDDDSSI